MSSSRGCPKDARSEFDRETFALLFHLESSLRASQQALLDRDVRMLDRLTAEQSCLVRRVSDLWQRRAVSPADEVSIPLFPALREIAWRVLHLGRIHQALLSRAQRSLRVAVNMAAGTGATYSPFSASPRQDFKSTKEA
jgi:hypothetical protein